MSATAVTERVQRLEQAGVVLGYRLDAGPAALGLPVTAFVRIQAAPASYRRSPNWGAGIPAPPPARTGSVGSGRVWSVELCPTRFVHSKRRVAGRG
jgi:hypothetical protein